MGSTTAWRPRSIDGERATLRTRTLGDVMTNLLGARMLTQRPSPHTRVSEAQHRILWMLLGLGTGLVLILPPVHLMTERPEVAIPGSVRPAQATMQPGDSPILLRGPQPVVRAGASEASVVIADPELAERNLAKRRLADQLQRARGLAKARNISQARLVLEDAARTGDGEALFLLGEMFDPNHLAALGILEVRAEAARARHLYTQALQAGFEPAKARLDQLE